jgi:uncharacterized protein YeaO (DUF488 family)
MAVMLGRYTMVRGTPPSELPKGNRQDTRKHTQHVLRPTPQMVEAVLSNPGDPSAWRDFAKAYRELLDQRFGKERAKFDALAAAARTGDVYLGCSCPTARNPDVRRCHTTHALVFMQTMYPDLEVYLP